jgi:3-methylfumaryl-CoA hydratase
MDLQQFQQQIGSRRVVTAECIAATRAELYRLNFDPSAQPVGERCALPAGRHGLYFQPVPSRAELRPDGSAYAGVIPDLPLATRIFGSESTRFYRPLWEGKKYVMTAELAGVRERGPLVLVTVREQIQDDEGIAVETERVTIFMDRRQPRTTPARVMAAPTDCAWEEVRTLDAIDLFRFSALTVNAHRAHYDKAWTAEVEGYAALLVHGPLTAMLLLDFALRQLEGEPVKYEARATAPLFVDQPFRLIGRPAADGADLWAVSDSGVAMCARLTMAIAGRCT